MSHFTRVRTQLRNMDTLKKALTDLGYEIRADGMARGYGGQQAQADLVARVSGSYDVGFRREGDHIVLVADFWGLRVDRKQFLDQISQRYAYHTVMEQAELQGWQAVAQETQPDGSIRLVMQRWA